MTKQKFNLFSIKNLFVFVLLLKIFLIFSNNLLNFYIMVGPDSLGIHNYSVSLSKHSFDFSNVSLFYFIISKLYSVFMVESYIEASFLMLLIWSCSFFLFSRILKLLEVNKKSQFIIMSIFSFWPSLIVFSITVNREVFQTFFILLHLYFITNFICKKKFIYIFLSFCSIFFMSIFHAALFFSSVFVILFSILLYFFYEKKINLKLLSFTLSLLILAIIFFNHFDDLGILYFKNLQFGLSHAVSSYQNGLLQVDLRANMQDYPVNIENIIELLIFFFKAFLDYFLQPYLRSVISFSDIVAFFENLLRISIIIAICYNLRSNNINSNKHTILFFCYFLFIEFIWSIGTSNWGTAIRHHSVAVPVLLATLSTIFKKKKTILY